MPRKTPAQRKANVSVEVTGEDIKTTKGSTPRRSGRASAKTEDSGVEAERSRRSSTAAQTAASVAESRVTRSGRNPKRESTSPAADKSHESLASRARSSRRSAQNVNYKESDGEEEVPTPKNEENFESNEEFDESDSDEKNKKKIRKGRSPQKGRGSKPKPRAAAKGGKRGRPTRRKKESEEEEEEDEEEETVEISDDSNQIDSADTRKKEVDSTSETKHEEKTGTGRRKARAASASVPPTDAEESAEKRGRRSCRSTAARPAPTPSKRPSRNKQIKKYTEVEEEDFSDVKSEGEDYETEVKKESSRKRKRETEVEANKRPRREKPEMKAEEPEEKSGNEEEEEEEEAAAGENKESEAKKPASEAKETVHEQSDEPMDVDEKPLTISTDSGKDESLPESKDVANRETKKVPEHEKVASAPEKAENMDSSEPPPHAPEAVEELKKEAGDKTVPQAEKTEVKEPQSEPLSSGTKVDGETGKSREISCSEGEALSANSKDSVLDSVSPMEQDTQKDDVSKPVDSVPAAQSRDDTFLSKDQAPAVSVNGEDTSAGKKDSIVPAKDTPVPETDSSFQHQNSTVPNTNGAREELEDEKRTVSNDVVFPLPCRQFIFNRYVGEDIRSSLKDGTFGIVSYNVSSGTASADKLIKELDKLQASIICLQEVSKTLFTEAIESKLDVLGYKAISNSPWSENGLVTFYKTSAFRITNVVDVPLQKLISEALESSNLEESEKQAVSQCFDKCGSVLITQLATVLGSHAVTVANVRIPPCSMSLNALQVSCVTRKIATMREHIKPVLICGEFNLSENEVPYHLLKNGYLTDRMVEELKSRTDGSECASLIKLLQKVCQNPSCAMSSCYGSVLGKELELPKSKGTSPDIVWASADNLHVIGVLDVASDSEACESDHRISLKADVAFFM